MPQQSEIIILEGIATSGKSTVIKYLSQLLGKSNLTFTIVGEDITLMPILNNTEKVVSLNLLKRAINNAIQEGKDLIIFDRLFFTHIFKTSSEYSDFREIEEMIQNSALLVFLKIDEEQIPARIEYARQHRDKAWDEYISTKGSDEEAYDYYINQQRILENLLSKTNLKYQVYNTTNLDCESIAKDLLERIL
jgi:thymidylate kinase